MCHASLSIVVWAFLPIIGLSQSQSPLPKENKSSTSIVPQESLPTGALVRLGTSRFRLGDYIQALALSPDGKQIAIGSNQALFLMDAKTGQKVGSIPNTTGTVRSLAYHPNGEHLAILGYSNTVRFVDVTTGRPLFQVSNKVRDLRMREIQFSRDGKFFTGNNDGYSKTNPIYVWEVSTQKSFGPFQPLQNRSIQATLSSQGKLLATWGRYSSSGNPGAAKNPAQILQIWDRSTGKEIRQLKTPGYFTNAAFSPDGKFLAAVIGRSTLTVWDVATGKEVATFAGQMGMGTSIQFSPPGAKKQLLAVGSRYGTIQLWDTRTWKRVPLPASPRCQFKDFTFAKEGKIIACGFDGRSIVVWEVKTGTRHTPEGGHVQAIQAISFSEDGQKVYSADASGRVCLWNRQTGKELQSWILPSQASSSASSPARFQAMAFSPNNKYLAASDNYSTGHIDLWDVQSQRMICEFEGPSSYGGIALNFSPNGQKLAILNSDSTFMVWEVASGRRLHWEKLSNKRVSLSQQSSHVAFSPDSKILALTLNYYDSQLRQQVSEIYLWDVATGKEMKRISRPGSQYSSLAFSPDGRYLATGDNSRRVVLWKVSTGLEAGTLTLPVTGQVSKLAFSPDGRALACSLYDYNNRKSSIWLWELATNQIRYQYQGYSGLLSSLEFSPDGQTLASGSVDTLVLLWDSTGRFLAAKKPEPDAEQMESLWRQMSQPAGHPAFQAIGKMISTPKWALPLLKNHLKPVPRQEIDEAKIRKLVQELAHPKFLFRIRAERKLKSLGRTAEPFLREALTKKNISVELEQRIQPLLALLDARVFKEDELQAWRGIEVLERIGNDDAKQLLTLLAEGDPGALLTEQAQAALHRLKK